MPPECAFQPLKYLVQINALTLGEETNPETVISYIDISSVDSDGFVAEATELTFGAAPSRARRVLRTGDVFISTVRTYLTAIAFCDARMDSFVCSTGFAVLTAQNRVLPKFLHYWARSSNFVGEVVARSTGVSYPAINASEIGNLPFPLLALDHQQTIADFLDRKTGQIDALIAKKQRQIELLSEKRQVLVSQAITKGLDATASMKDSCVPWLGDVPAHWNVERLRWRLLRIGQGWSPQCEGRQAEPGEWGVLKVGCMNSETYDESENKALPSDLPPPPELEIRVGDILMSRSNTVELVGAVGMVHQTQGRILLCDKLYRLIFDASQLLPSYSVHLLRSRPARLQIERDATGASPSMKNISNEVVANLVFAFPPVY